MSSLTEKDVAKPLEGPGAEMLAPRPSHVPPHQWISHWLTIREFSRLVDRSPWTIYGWLADGTFGEFGLSVYGSRYGKKHSARFFIKNPYF